MRRGVMFGIIAAAAVCFILAIALASVGTELDQARLERDDLEIEAEDLRSEVDSLRKEHGALEKERDTLKTKVGEHVKSIEQLKAELERQSRSQAAGSVAP